MVASAMDGEKRNNDPWVPLPNDVPQALPTAPMNPLHNMIDSDRYIETLERKLAQITENKRKRQEPTSKEIINSLALFHDDQMRRYVSDVGMTDLSMENAGTSDEPVATASFMQRKLHPERQPLSAEEIVELVREDTLAKTFEEIMESQVITPKELQAKLDEKQSCASTSTSSVKSADMMQAADGNKEKAKSGRKADSQPNQSAEAEPAEENWANFDEIDIEQNADIVPNES